MKKHFQLMRHFKDFDAKKEKDLWYFALNNVRTEHDHVIYKYRRAVLACVTGRTIAWILLRCQSFVFPVVSDKALTRINLSYRAVLLQYIVSFLRPMRGNAKMACFVFFDHDMISSKNKCKSMLYAMWIFYSNLFGER